MGPIHSSRPILAINTASPPSHRHPITVRDGSDGPTTPATPDRSNSSPRQSRPHRYCHLLNLSQGNQKSLLKMTV